jgi:glycosyltransferase involved in cell wall biosynthesis
MAVTTLEVGSRSYVAERRQLTALISRLQPRLVHTHGYRADVIAASAARAARVPTVSTVHGFTGGGFRNKVYELVQSAALNRSDAVIAVSASMVPRLIRAGVSESKIHCVPNGFVPPEQRISRTAARTKLGIPEDARVIGWIGRLSEEKGADVMLQALALTNSGWRLSVIGEGAARDRLLQQAERLGISGRVTWHGAVENAAAILPAFDAFVLSSRTEGTPIVLFEAMDAAVPVIATSVGGVPAVISAEEAILVPPDAPEAIATGLADLERNQAEARQRAERAARRVTESFGKLKWLASIGRVYDAVLAEKGRQGR